MSSKILKFLSVILVLVMSAGLAACAGGATPAPEQPQEEPQAEEALLTHDPDERLLEVTHHSSGPQLLGFDGTYGESVPDPPVVERSVLPLVGEEFHQFDAHEVPDPLVSLDAGELRVAVHCSGIEDTAYCFVEWEIGGNGPY